MTLEEAKKLVIESGYLKKLGEILDYGDFWVFCFPPDEEQDCSPPAISKKDGSLVYYFPPDFRDRKFRKL